MSIAKWSVEWLNANSQRAYPLADDASRRDTTNSITLPNSLLVGLHLPVPYHVDTLPDKVFLQRLVVAGDYIILTFGWAGETIETIANVSISVSGFSENTTLFAECSGTFDGSQLVLCVGKLDETLSLPAGVYEFNQDGAAVDPHCLYVHLQAVSSLRCRVGGVLGPRLYGPLVVAAGNGIGLTSIVSDEEVTVRIDAVPGGDIQEDACECIDPVPPCIRTINGQSGEDFVIITDNCLSLSVAGETINLEDVCSKPCCGNKELEEVYRAVRLLEHTVNTAEQYLTRLSHRVDVLQQTLLVSNPGFCMPEEEA